MTKEPTKIDVGWTLLEHTADIRMAVHGSSMRELFINAAQGFTNLLAPESRGLSDTDLTLRLEADSIEELLVDWLRELLFHHETRGFILVSADIEETFRHHTEGQIGRPDTRPQRRTGDRNQGRYLPPAFGS